MKVTAYSDHQVGDVTGIASAILFGTWAGYDTQNTLDHIIGDLFPTHAHSE